MDQQWLKDIQDPDPEVRRQTIIALAESGEKRALEVLKRVYKQDPDPALRNLARTAGQHLWQKMKGDKALQNLAKSKGTGNQVTEAEGASGEEDGDDEDAGDEEPTPRGISDKEKEAARARFERALSMHLNDDTEKAIRVFSQALELNPHLPREDEVAANLAKELTGLSAEEAVQALLDEERREAFNTEAEAAGDSSGKTGPPITLILLLIALLVLLGLAFNFVRTGTLGRYQTWVTVNFSGRHRENVGGQVYYLVPPRGRKPAQGWPVVVGMHGYGGNGTDMLSIANRFTSQGIVYVAPTFGNYAPNPGSGTLVPMSRILEDVDAQYGLDRERIVLLGYSQGGTFAYRFSVYHPEWVSGVVTAGAPELDARDPPTSTLPYVFTWGANDGLQDFVIPVFVDPHIKRGFNVTYHIVENAGHEVTLFAVNQALQLVTE